MKLEFQSKPSGFRPFRKNDLAHLNFDYCANIHITPSIWTRQWVEAQTLFGCQSLVKHLCFFYPKMVVYLSYYNLWTALRAHAFVDVLSWNVMTQWWCYDAAHSSWDSQVTLWSVCHDYNSDAAPNTITVFRTENLPEEARRHCNVQKFMEKFSYVSKHKKVIT